MTVVVAVFKIGFPLVLACYLLGFQNISRHLGSVFRAHGS